MHYCPSAFMSRWKSPRVASCPAKQLAHVALRPAWSHLDGSLPRPPPPPSSLCVSLAASPLMAWECQLLPCFLAGLGPLYGSGQGVLLGESCSSLSGAPFPAPVKGLQVYVSDHQLIRGFEIPLGSAPSYTSPCRSR